ncbi:glycosyltransferase family 4 protein [Actinospongicola halichondriae]|uniref:glycosyltransferase family 4 protein n=1 Tax=Actinospongicola halichondriae TaxID=3236844 RepID=UPI003D5C2EB8
MTVRRRRVGINLCWLVPGGVGGSEQATVRALAALHRRAPRNFEIVLLASTGFVDAYPELASSFETHTIPLPAGRRAVRVLAEHTWLPAMVRRLGIDLLHDAGGTSPGSVEVPRVLTIHDIQPLLYPQRFPRTRVAFLRRAIPSAVAGARRITVPSAFVRSSLVEHLDADPDRIDVVPWSTPDVGGRADVDLVRGRWGLQGPTLVLPAITYAHKDHITAIRAVGHLVDRHPDLKLVLPGGVGPAEPDVLAEIKRLGLGGRVIRTGRLPNASVLALIEGATAVVFPSRYEGFGIPVLEAMSLGAPVVAADAGALVEVIGDAGVVFPAGDDHQLAIEVHRVLSDEVHRASLVDAGRLRAATFGPERTAERLLAAYRSASIGQ